MVKVAPVGGAGSLGRHILNILNAHLTKYDINVISFGP